MSDSKLVYCATPTRMHERGLGASIRAFVRRHGHSPFYPHNAFPREDFEDGPAGRDGTIAHCCSIVELAGELWVFGISEGVMVEFAHALRCGKPVHLLYRDFDKEEWMQPENQKLLMPIPNLLSDLNLPVYSELREEIEMDLAKLVQ